MSCAVFHNMAVGARLAEIEDDDDENVDEIGHGEEDVQDVPIENPRKYS